MMLFQVEIPKRASLCHKGGETLEPSQEYFSTLSEGEEAGTYQRRDYCRACWEAMGNQPELPTGSGSWRSVVPTIKPVSDLPKKRDDRALYLLKEALNQQTPESAAEAFVLSLYLARRRLIALRHEMNQPPRGALSIYEVAATEEMLCVPKLSLSELQVEKLQLELAKKFKGT